jgi:hypothetical protein
MFYICYTVGNRHKIHSYTLQPPHSSYFNNSDVSHDLAQGLHKS